MKELKTIFDKIEYDNNHINNFVDNQIMKKIYSYRQMIKWRNEDKTNFKIFNKDMKCINILIKIKSIFAVN